MLLSPLLFHTLPLAALPLRFHIFFAPFRLLLLLLFTCQLFAIITDAATSSPLMPLRRQPLMLLIRCWLRHDIFAFFLPFSLSILRFFAFLSLFVFVIFFRLSELMLLIIFHVIIATHTTPSLLLILRRCFIYYTTLYWCFSLSRADISCFSITRWLFFVVAAMLFFSLLLFFAFAFHFHYFVADVVAMLTLAVDMLPLSRHDDIAIWCQIFRWYWFSRLSIDFSSLSCFSCLRCHYAFFADTRCWCHFSLMPRRRHYFFFAARRSLIIAAAAIIATLSFSLSPYFISSMLISPLIFSFFDADAAFRFLSSHTTYTWHDTTYYDISLISTASFIFWCCYAFSSLSLMLRHADMLLRFFAWLRYWCYYAAAAALRFRRAIFFSPLLLIADVTLVIYDIHITPTRTISLPPACCFALLSLLFSLRCWCRYATLATHTRTTASLATPRATAHYWYAIILCWSPHNMLLLFHGFAIIAFRFHDGWCYYYTLHCCLFHYFDIYMMLPFFAISLRACHDIYYCRCCCWWYATLFRCWCRYLPPCFRFMISLLLRFSHFHYCFSPRPFAAIAATLRWCLRFSPCWFAALILLFTYYADATPRFFAAYFAADICRHADAFLISLRSFLRWCFSLYWYFDTLLFAADAMLFAMILLIAAMLMIAFFRFAWLLFSPLFRFSRRCYADDIAIAAATLSSAHRLSPSYFTNATTLHGHTAADFRFFAAFATLSIRLFSLCFIIFIAIRWPLRCCRLWLPARYLRCHW